ncbi:MAG: tetratricopeptide repeat protein [Gammaproteobacteria bacterium]
MPDSDPVVAKAYEVFEKVRSVADKNSMRLPELLITEKQMDPWALALPDGNIVLSRFAVDLCFRLKQNSEACLAFVLGHELAHLANDDFWHQEVYGFLNTHQRSQDLAMFLKKQSSLKAKEIAADDKGYVYAAIAGFPVNRLFSSETEGKKFFELWVGQGSSAMTDTHGSAKERAMLLQQRLSEIQSKLVFFDFGIRLSHFDYCDDAIPFFIEFLHVFPGREVLNDLGYCYLQLARHEMDPERAFLYWMPLLLDIETRAIGTVRGFPSGITSLKEAADDNEGYLKQAEEFLTRAVQADPFYLPARLNLAIAYLYLGKPHSAKATIVETLKRYPDDERLRMLDALAVYEQSEDGMDLWSAAVAKLHAIDSPSEAAVFNLARLLSLRSGKEAPETYWDRLVDSSNELPFPIQSIVCQKQKRVAVSDCLKSIAMTPSALRLWQWPLPEGKFVQIDESFRKQYLDGWSCLTLNWLKENLQGNIYSSPDGTVEMLELGRFIQMQVDKKQTPLDETKLARQCSQVVHQRDVLGGSIRSCGNWAILVKNNIIEEAWMISN